MYHSLTSDVHAASVESGGCVVSAHGEMKLCVVSILVVLYGVRNAKL